jgi:hypothetical protein
VENAINDLIPVIAAVFACLVFVILFSLAFIMSRRQQQSTKLTIQQLEETFGLVNQNPKGIYLDLGGEVEGLEVSVDVIFQYYSSSGPSSSERPWTRVRAQLPEPPSIQVRSRHQKYGKKIEWPLRKTDDPAFDQKYELFMPESSSIDEALPPLVRDALMAADPPVHILNNVVVWSKAKTGHSPELVKNAVWSCVRVASAIANSV